MQEEKNNPFFPLAEMFPDERFDEIGQLFDSGSGLDIGEDQWRLNGLAVLLGCLENYDGEGPDPVDIESPLICKIRALEAAYQLGRDSA